MREDVSLLLSPEQMGGLAMQLNELVRSLFKYSRKIGFLHYLYFDFDDVHASRGLLNMYLDYLKRMN